MSGDEGRALRRGQVSGRSSMPSFIRFCNRTNRLVDIIWLNYEGLGVRYRTLPPRHFIDVNTFVGHPWIFRDSLTGDKCIAQFKTVYEPVGNGEGPPRRRLINITIPVFKLKDRCLQVLKSMVPRQAIPHLEIPVVLQEELLANSSDYDISMAPDEAPAAPGSPAAAAQPSNRNIVDNGSRILNPRIPSQLVNLLAQPSSADNSAEPQAGSSRDDTNRTELQSCDNSSDDSDS